MFGGGGGGGGGRENEALGRLTHMMMLPMSLHVDEAAISAVSGGGGIGGGGGGGGDDEFPRRDERLPPWSQQETRDFIAIRAELERDFNVSKRNKTLWEVVAAKMKERGYRRSPDQCKCKWKNLVNRYKGKETSGPNDGRPCPFFEELQAVFIERAKNMQRSLLESEAGSNQAKKRFKKISGDQSSEEFSEDEDEDEEESEGERVMRSMNPRKRKAEKNKRLALDKSSRQSSGGNITSSGSSLSGVQDMLREFLQQQQRIEMQWRESMERRAHERQLFEQEWRQSMEKIERERLMIEQAWRDREEQRRIKEESRAEKRDALLTTLLNKLIHEN